MATQKLVEFYNERQGRPESNIALDMESRMPSIPPTYVSTMVLRIMEEEMKEQLDEMVAQNRALLAELKQIKLHLASLSNASVDEEDGGD